MNKLVEQKIREAGVLLEEGFLLFQNYREKERGHLQSDFDIKVDKILQEYLAFTYPQDSIYSEETTLKQGKSDTRWIIDPMDGTAYFIFGEPYFSITIAKEVRGEIVEGHVYNPMTKEYYYSDKASGIASLNGQQISVSSVEKIEDSLMTFGFSVNMKKIQQYYTDWSYLMDNCKKGLPWICPALSICNVARGRVEGFIDLGCSYEGQAAASLILKNAGGAMVNYDGAAYEPRVTGGVFTNGRLAVHPK